MKVACDFDQHSPMFGHAASSQTVVSPVTFNFGIGFLEQIAAGCTHAQPRGFRQGLCSLDLSFLRMTFFRFSRRVSDLQTNPLCVSRNGMPLSCYQLQRSRQFPLFPEMDKTLQWVSEGIAMRRTAYPLTSIRIFRCCPPGSSSASNPSVTALSNVVFLVMTFLAGSAPLAINLITRGQ